MKKNKIDEDNFEKKYYKKKKTQKKLEKKPCEEKLVFTCNCNS